MILHAMLALSALLTTSTEAAPEPKPLELTMMTFNVRYGTAQDGDNAWPKRRDLVVETIRQYNPDVVGVQECLLFQADYIEDNLRGYRWLGVGREHSGGGEMTAIFYRQKDLMPVDSGTFWLSEQPDVPGSKSWDSSLPRICTWAKFYHPDSRKFFHVYNNHFDHMGQQAREESAKMVSQRVSALPQEALVFVLGDFNSYAETTAPFQTFINGGMFDAWLSAAERKGPATTWSGFKAPDPDSKQRIDWILFRGALTCLEAETVTYNQEGRYPTDHYPVVAKFREE